MYRKRPASRGQKIKIWFSVLQVVIQQAQITALNRDNHKFRLQRIVQVLAVCVCVCVLCVCVCVCVYGMREGVSMYDVKETERHVTRQSVHV